MCFGTLPCPVLDPLRGMQLALRWSRDHGGIKPGPNFHVPYFPGNARLSFASLGETEPGPDAHLIMARARNTKNDKDENTPIGHMHTSRQTKDGNLGS